MFSVPLWQSCYHISPLSLVKTHDINQTLISIKINRLLCQQVPDVKLKATLTNYHKLLRAFKRTDSRHVSRWRAGFDYHALHKKHNVEDVRLKARPVGRSPKARLCVIAFHHAISMLSKQCLDSGFWVAPEFMIISQSCLKVNGEPLNLSA